MDTLEIHLQKPKVHVEHHESRQEYLTSGREYIELHKRK